MTRHPPRSTLTATLFPYTTLFRSAVLYYIRSGMQRPAAVDDQRRLGDKVVIEPIMVGCEQQAIKFADIGTGQFDARKIKIMLARLWEHRHVRVAVAHFGTGITQLLH